jgi:hypothetical protein
MSEAPQVALTHSSTLRRLLYEALAELGLDPTDTYRRAYAGMPLTVPLLEAREDHDSAPRFWQALAGISGDADIGLHLGDVMRPRPMDVVGYLLLAARDLRQGRCCCRRCWRRPAASCRCSASTSAMPRPGVCTSTAACSASSRASPSLTTC